MTDSERAIRRQSRQKVLARLRHFWAKASEIYENLRWASEKESWPRLILRWTRNLVWLWDNLLTRRPVDPFAAHMATLDVTALYNPIFVAFFWGSSISDGFELSTVVIDNNERVTKATHPLFGTLYFWANRNSTVVVTDSDGTEAAARTPLPVFYHSPGFDFGGLVEGFWRSCGGAILVERKSQAERALGTAYTWTPMPENNDPIFGSARARYEAFRVRYEQRVADGISRTYLWAGPTGNAKTTGLFHLAKDSGHRFLFIPASFLFELNVAAAKQLLDAFQTTSLVVEDIDHGEHVDRDKDDTLLLLARFRVLRRGTALFLTANDTDKLDPAFISRVNQIELFDNPGPGEARLIFERYLEVLGVKRLVDVDRLMSLMDDMPGRDIRQVAEDCLETDSDDEVAQTVQQRRKAMKGSVAAYEHRRRMNSGQTKAVPPSELQRQVEATQQMVSAAKHIAEAQRASRG